jgi:hypothetical protein
MVKKIALSLVAVGLAVGIALSQDKMEEKKAPAKSGGLLQPDMEPTGGWNSQGDVGQKSSDPWSNTTKGAAVDGKPVPGHVVTLTGEILDLSCYFQVGKHGDKHSSCGKKCIANGEPIGLLTKNGSVYVLMAEEHDPRRDGQVGFRKAAADNFAKVMTVTGTATTVNGVKSVFVQGYVGK